MWAEELHNRHFITDMLAIVEGKTSAFGTAARLKGMLTMAQSVSARSMIELALISLASPGTAHALLFHAVSLCQFVSLHMSISSFCSCCTAQWWLRHLAIARQCRKHQDECTACIRVRHLSQVDRSKPDQGEQYQGRVACQGTAEQVSQVSSSVPLHTAQTTG